MENQHKTKTKKFKSISTNTVPHSSALFSETTTKCHLKNNYTTKEIYSSTRDPAFSYKAIPLGPVLDNSSVSDLSLTTSMVAHFTLVNDSFQNPSSLSSMVPSCQLLGTNIYQQNRFLLKLRNGLKTFGDNKGRL